MYELCPQAMEPPGVERAGHNDIELYTQYLGRIRLLTNFPIPEDDDLILPLWLWARVLRVTHAFPGRRSWCEHHKEARSFSASSSDSRGFLGLSYREILPIQHIVLSGIVVTPSFIALQGGNESWVGEPLSHAVKKRMLTPLCPPYRSGRIRLCRTQPLSTHVLSIWPAALFQPQDSRVQSICEAVTVYLETLVMKIPSFIFINMPIFSPKQIN